MGGLLEESVSADGVHQAVEESVEVAGGGIGEERDPLRLGLLAQLPHFIPGLGNLPALLLEEAGVVEQTAGAVEHGHEIGFTVGIGLGERGVQEAGEDLILHLDVFARHGHLQDGGQIPQRVVLGHGFGQGQGSAGGQVYHIGVVARLHVRADNVFQILVDGQFDGNAFVFRFESGLDLLPHIGAVSGFQSRYLQGGLFAAAAGTGILRGLAAGEQG